MKEQDEVRGRRESQAKARKARKRREFRESHAEARKTRKIRGSRAHEAEPRKAVKHVPFSAQKTENDMFFVENSVKYCALREGKQRLEKM